MLNNGSTMNRQKTVKITRAKGKDRKEKRDNRKIGKQNRWQTKGEVRGGWKWGSVWGDVRLRRRKNFKYYYFQMNQQLVYNRACWMLNNSLAKDTLTSLPDPPKRLQQQRRFLHLWPLSLQVICISGFSQTQKKMKNCIKLRFHPQHPASTYGVGSWMAHLRKRVEIAFPVSGPMLHNPCVPFLLQF